jgi:hypothetical protein
MTAAEWLARASKRDRLLVWQHDDPFDLALPANATERLIVRYAVTEEFAKTVTPPD